MAKSARQRNLIRGCLKFPSLVFITINDFMMNTPILIAELAKIPLQDLQNTFPSDVTNVMFFSPVSEIRNSCTAKTSNNIVTQVIKKMSFFYFLVYCKALAIIQLKQQICII